MVFMITSKVPPAIPPTAAGGLKAMENILAKLAGTSPKLAKIMSSAAAT